MKCHKHSLPEAPKKRNDEDQMMAKQTIKKTSLLKHTEDFTTKNENFQIKILIFFIFLLKTWIVGTR